MDIRCYLIACLGILNVIFKEVAAFNVTGSYYSWWELFHLLESERSSNVTILGQTKNRHKV